METITQFQHAHPAIVAIAAYMIFMAFVSGMPDPNASSGIAYRWCFTSLHILSVNLNFLWKSKGLPVLPGQSLQASSTTQPDGTTQSTVNIAAAPEPPKD